MENRWEWSENRWERGGQVAVVREWVGVVREQVGVWTTGGSGQRTGGSMENKWEWSENSGSVEDRWECGGQVAVVREQVGMWRAGGSVENRWEWSENRWQWSENSGSVEDRWQWSKSRWEAQQPHRGDWRLPLGQSPVPSRLSAPCSTLAAQRTWQGSCVPKCQFSGLTLEISVFVP
ncbi:uncharacterized protein LOC121020174 isoform X17 [Herpailurus yagouaroundi]|uniref:uncharacterized protein LOC121020174 isoform X17 n=1 Tax=Herpailurus yagouaroundi TaxID=1608482 RepID=UPI001AD7A968|nr:uncharacterized protein LOC121020174 isoform X17 [Puma yagouaroundi]